jgi:hypothetical protein
MQISAANLLAASQAAKPTARPQTTEKDGFEPLTFKQMGPARQQDDAPAPGVHKPLGSQVDITV